VFITCHGTVTLDTEGRATVEIPGRFTSQATFHYLITCIGTYAPIYISKEMNSQTRAFEIAGGFPNLKVSWELIIDEQNNQK